MSDTGSSMVETSPRAWAGAPRQLARVVAVAVAAPWMLAAGISMAGPASPDPGSASASPAAETNAVGAGDELAPRRQTVSVPEAQRRVEAATTRLDEIAERAEAERAAAEGENAGVATTRATCARAHRDRGAAITEVATGELLVVRSPNATAEQKAFAAEKLRAAADRIEGVVDQALRCLGDVAADGPLAAMDNELDAPQTIPMLDPTLGGAFPPVPPAVDANFPLAVASPSI